LELGCGSGNHAQHLARPGLRIVGLERSATMVAQAQEKAIQGFNPLVGDITAYSLPDQFDAAVALFHVISYLTDNTELTRCFRHTYNHLKPGGVFLFDVWYSPAVLHQQPETRIRRMENERVAVTRLAEPVHRINKNTVDVQYEVWVKDKHSGVLQIISETHPMRHFSIPEIELIAAYTGFDVCAAEAFLTGAKPGHDTWGICFVLKKRYE
jgi:SAM-dependent methyltransferase